MLDLICSRFCIRDSSCREQPGESRKTPPHLAFTPGIPKELNFNPTQGL